MRDHIYKKLYGASVEPHVWILDNETSNALKDTMAKNETTYQFVPHHTHCANFAEQAIQTFKNHLNPDSSDLTQPTPSQNRVD